MNSAGHSQFVCISSIWSVTLTEKRKEDKFNIKVTQTGRELRLLVVKELRDPLIRSKRELHFYLNNSCSMNPSALCLLHWFPFDMSIQLIVNNTSVDETYVYEINLSHI